MSLTHSAKELLRARWRMRGGYTNPQTRGVSIWCVVLTLQGRRKLIPAA